MSNRLTFSLASLILMFAFVVIPAMAHDVDPDADGQQHTTGGADIGDHDHLPAPTVTVELVDIMARAAGSEATTDPTSSTVSGNNVTLTVDADATDPIAVDLAGATDGEFQVKITFSEPVYSAPAATTTTMNDDLAVGDLTITAASQAATGANLIDNGVTVAVARMADDTETMGVNESLNTFIVTFTVTRALIGDSDAEPVAPGSLPVDVWVTVNAGVLTTLDGRLIGGVEHYGTANTASDREMFTIVSMLDPVPVTATAAADTVGGDDEIVVTLTAEAPYTVPSLTNDDFAVTGGTAHSWDPGENTLTITSLTDATVTVAPSEAGMAKISFDTVTVTVDSTGPEVTISDPTPAAPIAGDDVTVTITVTGADTDEAIVLDDISVVQTPTSGTAKTLGHSYDAGVVTFTPDAESTVTVTVAADAVEDEFGNGNEVETSSITVAPAPEPTVAVMATPDPTTIGGTVVSVVTLTAADPAMVPSGLTDDDFAVTGGTGEWDDAEDTLTITADADGTGDVTVAAAAPAAGSTARISFDPVTIMVDRTGPEVTFSDVTGAEANAPVMVTISVAADATQGAIALEHITVTQVATDGTESELTATYNVNTGAVTFTPDAESTVTVRVAANAVMDEFDNGNTIATSAPIAVAAAPPPREVVAVMAAAADDPVNGSTDIVVTLSATDPAMVPDDLTADDFTVMEGDTALIPVVGDKDATTGTVTLTITPAGTGDTTVTVDPSTAGAAKISFDTVTVEVDRIGPMVAFSSVTGAQADTPVTVTITVTGADADQTIAVTDIGVVQTVSDGTAKGLEHTYNAGVVTFTPDAESTVTVTVDANAVMDAVGNGNAEATSGNITVLAADAPPIGQPTNVKVALNTAEDGYTVSWTDADDDRVNGYYVSYNPVEFVLAGVENFEITAALLAALDGPLTSVSVWSTTDTAAADSPPPVPSTVTPVTDLPDIPAGPADGTFTIPAKSYIVIGHDEGTSGLPASITPMTWAAMPDLENLLHGGGTLLLTHVKADKIDRDNDPATDAVEAKKRDALITEVMAAVNLAEVGQAGYTAHQWIELYNNLDIPLTVSIRAIAGRETATNPLDASATEIRLDRLSNQVGAGWTFEGLGQNGSYDGNANTADTDFVSFYRKERAGDKDGHVKGHWATSTAYYLAGHKGTPGAKERSTAVTVKPTEFSIGGLIFNEISNRKDADKAYEWIELRNKSGGEINPKKWRISIVTAVGSDVDFFTFPDNDNVKIAAGDVFLLVKSDPSGDPSHPLAAGWNVAKNAANQVNGVGAHSPRYLVANFAGDGLPDDGEFVLILRNTNDNGKLKKPENLIDIAGYSTKLKVSANEAGFTNLWPLVGGVRNAELGNNKLEVDQVHRRQKDNIWGTSSTNYGRDGGNHADDTAWRGDGWTGIGYKRNAAANGINGGTPGYNHGTLKSEGIAQGSQVIISEIMFDASRNLPQWIELQNLSTATGVNIDNWSIFVVNHNLNVDGSDYVAGKLSERIDLDGRIPPGQTFLIVSTGNRSDTQLPSERVHNLRRGRGETLLNPNGFRIQLKAKTNEGDAAKHQLVDDVGNLPDKPAGSRRADAQSFMDPVWPMLSGTNEDGDRVSIARKTTKATDAQNRRTELLDLQKTGVSAWGWISSDADDRLSRMHSNTYYGHASDIASPGQTVGSILPVSLSKFRPERLDDGSIRIVWVTESETNNAGFNILRSTDRNGEFKQINTKLIAGQGTTSARTVYTHTDTSAKPNVVYYYQIQDVSLDGQVQTLRTTHLRGNVTAVGKATTTWGELKALQ